MSTARDRHHRLVALLLLRGPLLRVWQPVLVVAAVVCVLLAVPHPLTAVAAVLSSGVGAWRWAGWERRRRVTDQQVALAHLVDLDTAEQHQVLGLIAEAAREVSRRNAGAWVISNWTQHMGRTPDAVAVAALCVRVTTGHARGDQLRWATNPAVQAMWGRLGAFEPRSAQEVLDAVGQLEGDAQPVFCTLVDDRWPWVSASDVVAMAEAAAQVTGP